MAVDSANVYWTTAGTGCSIVGGVVSGTGTVQKAPIGGGQAVTLVSGLCEPWGIAVDGTSVYWIENVSNPFPGSLVKLTPK